MLAKKKKNRKETIKMKKTELVTQLLDNHNRLTQIEVHGDGTLLMAETLISLRRILNKLKTEEIEEESSN